MQKDDIKCQVDTSFCINNKVPDNALWDVNVFHVCTDHWYWYCCMYPCLCVVRFRLSSFCQAANSDSPDKTTIHKTMPSLEKVQEAQTTLKIKRLNSWFFNSSTQPSHHSHSRSTLATSHWDCFDFNLTIMWGLDNVIDGDLCGLHAVLGCVARDAIIRANTRLPNRWNRIQLTIIEIISLV